MSFGWEGLLRSHSIHSRLEIYNKTHTRQEQETKGRTEMGGGKKWIAVGIYKPLGYESLGEAILHSDEECFAATDPRTSFRIVLPMQRA